MQIFASLFLNYFKRQIMSPHLQGKTFLYNTDFYAKIYQTGTKQKRNRHAFQKNGYRFGFNFNAIRIFLQRLSTFNCQITVCLLIMSRYPYLLFEESQYKCFLFSSLIKRPEVRLATENEQKRQCGCDLSFGYQANPCIVLLLNL